MDEDRMNVAQAILSAREWVDLYGSRAPGFCGAHLMGSILSMSRDAPFPPHKDVDIMLVLDTPQGKVQIYPLDVCYCGFLLECSESRIERYRSPEKILSNPTLACNLAVNSILSDPINLLLPLHTRVAEEYTRRKWVRVRCAYEKQLVTESLEALHQAFFPFERDEAIFQLLSVMLYLAGLLAVACLIPPTYRRCLVLLSILLSEQGRVDLHEEALNILGYGHLAHQQVESYLQDCALAFDRALEVKRGPFPFAYKYHSHVRPYIITGAQEMILEGYYREAMPWIYSFLKFSTSALQLYAPKTEASCFQAAFEDLVQRLGLATPEELFTRFQRAKELARSIFAITDNIVEQLAE
jgi:hypothetical protein